MNDTGPRPDQLVAAVGPNKARQHRPVDELLSATMHSPYWQREDPFHEHWLWDTAPPFHSRYTARRENVDGQWQLVQTPAYDAPSSRDGAPLWSLCVNSEHVHRILAMLNGFHHATSRQLHAVCVRRRSG